MNKPSTKNILITGAYGFIGAYITAALLKEGHRITCAVRDVTRAQLKFPTCNVIHCDFNIDLTVDQWMAKLEQVDIVINIVGLLNSARGNDIENVHVKSTIALFEACRRRQVKKIIHISALGIDDENSTAYSRTKKQADNYLQTMQEMDWVILQPSLVYAAGSYGGTSLLRALAVLPVIPLIGDGQQKFQPVHIQDLCSVVVNCIAKKNKLQTTIKVAGAKPFTVKDILKSFRSWLGLKPTSFIEVPKILIKLAAKLGDILGWSPLNSTSYIMLEKGNTADIKKMQELTKVTPLNFSMGLVTEPLTIQSLWHARLYFLKPLLRSTLGLFWVFTGVNCLFLAPELARKYLATLGFAGITAQICILVGSIADIILGSFLLLRIKVVEIGILQMGIMIFYSTALSILDPILWLEPLGSLVKNIPVLLCTLVMLAIERDK